MKYQNLDPAFLTAILKGWTNLTKDERQALRLRQNKLNSDFSFTEVNLQKLRQINGILHQKEKEICAHANRIRAVQKQWLENEYINDHEFDCRISLWNSMYDQINSEFEGNPFYTDTIITQFGGRDYDTEEVFYTGNWNEFEHCQRHPLSKDFHCYTFHHLYDHTYLSWADIIGIEYIWIDIVVENQFCIEIPK